VDEPTHEGIPSLARDQQRLTRDRIRQAAMAVVARRGFDATVDEIAKVSGVSPRTIFRHYATHDLLIVTTVKDMYEACGLRPIEGLPPPSEDLDGWIEGLAVTIHTRNADIVGDAFWDIHAPRPSASEAFTELDGVRRDYRIRGVRYLVGLAWQTAGGVGEPPEDLVLAFALNFSAFTTQALMIDFDRSPPQIGALTADLLKMLLRKAVAERRSSHGDGSTDAPSTPG
jgi:AcrR family transcriptional regulator